MKTRMTGRRALTLAAAFGFASVAFAETNIWTSAASNAWATPENWDPQVVPTAEDVVRFDGDADVVYDAAALPVTNFVEKIELLGDDTSVRISNADSSVRRLHVLGKTAQSDGVYRFVSRTNQTFVASGSGLKVEVDAQGEIGKRGVIVKGTVVADNGANITLNKVDVGDNPPRFVAKNGGEIGFGGDVKIYDNAVLTIESDGSGSSVGTFGSLLNQNDGLYTVNLLSTNSAYLGVPNFDFSSKSILRLVSADDSTIQVGQISSLPKNSSILLANGDMILNGDLTLGGLNPITLTVDGCGTIENDNDAPGTTITLKSNATVRFKPDEKALGKAAVLDTCIEGSGKMTIDPASRLDIDMSVLGVDTATSHWEIPYIKCETPKNSNNNYDITALAIPVITITEGYDCKFKREKVTDSTMKVTLVINRSEVKTWSADAESAWNVDGSWTEGVAPAADDAVVFEKDATVVVPGGANSAASLTVAAEKVVTFVGENAGTLVAEDDALKSAIGANATVEVSGKQNTFKFHNTQGTTLGDNVTLKATDGGYLKVSHAVLDKNATVTLVADGSSDGVDSQMKFEATNANVTVNMTASNGGFLNLQGFATAGQVKLDATEGGRVDALSISPAADSSVVLSNGTLRIMNNGNLSLGASKKPMTLTLAGDDAAVFATNNYTEVTFGPELMVKLAPTEAWTEKTLVTVQSSSDPKTTASCKFTLAAGAKFEIDVAEFGEIGDGKMFRLASVAGKISTLTAAIPEPENVTVVGGENLMAVFQLSDDGKALDVVIAPMSDDDIPTQVANAKSGAIVLAPGVVIAEDGKSFTYDGGAAPVTKEHYVFKEALDGVCVEIDQAEAEIAAIAIVADEDGNKTVKVTLKNKPVKGFYYALKSSDDINFETSFEQIPAAVAEGDAVILNEDIDDDPVQFYRAVVTDVEPQPIN